MSISAREPSAHFQQEIHQRIFSKRPPVHCTRKSAWQGWAHLGSVTSAFRLRSTRHMVTRASIWYASAHWTKSLTPYLKDPSTTQKVDLPSIPKGRAVTRRVSLADIVAYRLAILKAAAFSPCAPKC